MSPRSAVRFRTCYACVTILAVLLGRPCRGHDAASIEKLWRERSNRIKEIHLKWVERLTHYSRPGVTAEAHGELALSAGGRIRLLSDQVPSLAGPGMRVVNAQPDPKKLLLERHISVYDGDTSAGLYGPHPGRSYHLLGLNNGVVPRWGFVANISALEMHLRPFADAPNALPDGLAGFESTVEELEGAKVVVLRKDAVIAKNGRNGGGRSLWVTNDERALMVRELFTQVNTDIPSIEIRTHYAKDADSGEWLPSGWDFKMFGVDGKFVVESRTAEVTEAYVHAPLPVELFRLESVPDGTFVNDQRDGKVVDYIHRSKEGPRRLRQGEFTGTNYDELRYSEPPAGIEFPMVKAIPLTR